jgi:hypothetical protein
MDLTPRVPHDVLHAALEGQLGGRTDAGGRVTVFVHDGPPFYVAERELTPLERRALARIPVAAAGVVTDLYEEPPPAEAGRIVNDAVGRFSLWGFQAAPPVKK